jgi:hypothetical protein
MRPTVAWKCVAKGGCVVYELFVLLLTGYRLASERWRWVGCSCFFQTFQRLDSSSDSTDQQRHFTGCTKVEDQTMQRKGGRERVRSGVASQTRSPEAHGHVTADIAESYGQGCGRGLFDDRQSIAQFQIIGPLVVGDLACTSSLQPMPSLTPLQLCPLLAVYAVFALVPVA